MKRNDGDWQVEVEKILEAAFGEGRRRLYEHEVYRILATLDIRTPGWKFLTKAEEITQGILDCLEGNRVVLKVVSPEVAHKEKLGGVKILDKKPEILLSSFEDMRKTFTDQGIPVAGILMAAFVEYSPALGAEILLGFRESETFGPVLSFGKGGSDAEHFASHFSAPAILLAPISRGDAQNFLSSTKFKDKFFRRFGEDYSDRFVDLQVKLGRLAAAYSQFFESPSRFVLGEFEINPFVFGPNGNLIALDGYALFDEKKTAHWAAPQGPPDGLSAFFEPRGIAVVGISGSDHTKVGNVIADNLTPSGPEGPFLPQPQGGQGG